MFIWVISWPCSFLWLLLELDGFLSSTKCLPANQVRIISFWKVEVFVSSASPMKSGPQVLHLTSWLNVRWDDIHPSLIQGLGKYSCYILLLLIIKLLFILRAMDEKTEHAFFLCKFCWSIVDLQCWVSFRCIAKGFSNTYTYVKSSSDSLPKYVITEYQVEFPVLYSRYLLVIYFINGSVCMEKAFWKFLSCR